MARVMLGVNELTVGGGPVLARNWVGTLKASGHHALIVGGEGSYAQTLRDEGWDVRVVPHLANGGPIAGAREMLAKMADWEPDIFVSQHLRGDVVADVLPSVPYSINVCRSQFRRKELLAKWASEGRVGTCDGVFLGEMREQLGESVRLLPLAVRDVRRREEPFRDSPIVGVVGRICPERSRGIGAALYWCNVLGLELKVVGVGETEVSLQEWAAEHGYETVEFLGEVYPPPYHEFDIHISMGGTVGLEAALAGVPTIVWDISADDLGTEAAGILGPGVMSPNGVLPVFEYQPSTFGSYIEKIASMSEAERQGIVATARQYVLDEHIARAGEEFLDFLGLA